MIRLSIILNNHTMNGGRRMKARITGPQIIIVVSLVLIALGLFTVLPYYIFSTIGVFGVLAGWLMDIKEERQKTDEENGEVNINVTDLHQVDFDERLRKLEKLKKDELISEEEYLRKRQEIIEDKW